MTGTPTPDWPGEYLWRQSPWDHKVHVFRELGEVHSEALCKHTATTNRLIEPLPQARTCLACLLIQGEQLWRSTGQEGVPW